MSCYIYDASGEIVGVTATLREARDLARRENGVRIDLVEIGEPLEVWHWQDIGEWRQDPCEVIP
jgi:hypothetical protein